MRTFSVPEKVIFIAALGLFGGLLLSAALWGGEMNRTFPALPLAGEAHPPESSLLSFYFTLGLALLAPVFPKNKIALAALPVWLIGLFFNDINRLQPWGWLYLLIFAVVFFGKKENETRTVTALQWLLAGVYFWSGFGKLTPYFAEDNFAWFCGAFPFTKPFGPYSALGYLIALLEMSFAAGLLWGKARPYFRWIIIGFHGVIIFFLWKLNWNHVVIPWNLGMAGMVWVLSPTPSPSPIGRGVRIANSKPSPLPTGEGLGVGPLFLLLPALHFFHLWPHNLSWQLYSNTQQEATFYSEKGLPCSSLSSIWEKYAFDEGKKLLLDDWANDELDVPMFASEKAFRRAGKYLCHCAATPDSAGLYILTVNRWNKSAEKLQKIPCRELLK